MPAVASDSPESIACCINALLSFCASWFCAASIRRAAFNAGDWDSCVNSLSDFMAFDMPIPASRLTKPAARAAVPPTIFATPLPTSVTVSAAN